ncbi:MAG: DUF3520 domain-containing protein [Deltaproteobacteria bacterium]|nr:DUF3520 domain-containing protein [Deltaproteobacteria bacterium]
MESYRLLGNENSQPASRKVYRDVRHADAMWPGQIITMLYEVVPTGQRTGRLFSVQVGYRQPGPEAAKLVSAKVDDSAKSFDNASRDFRFAGAVALFGMLLRDSEYSGDGDFATVRRLARGAIGGEDAHERREFLELVDLAEKIVGGMKAKG